MTDVLNKHIPYLYKYRSLVNKEYVFDILKNHRLYFPTRSGLNDPLEGVIQPIHFHTLGSTYFIENGYLQPEFNELLEEYRILSLSRTWNNMQMWAHYANNYKGICIAFKYNDVFLNAREVKYTSKRFKYIDERDIVTDKEFESTIKKNLLYKSKNWKYEYEYRIIEKTSEPFFYFPQNCIEEVIFGNILEIDRETVVEISKICNEQNIKLSYITFCTDYFEIKKESFSLYLYLNDEYNPYISNDVIMYEGQEYPIRTHFIGSDRIIESRK